MESCWGVNNLDQRRRWSRLAVEDRQTATERCEEWCVRRRRRTFSGDPNCLSQENVEPRVRGAQLRSQKALAMNLERKPN